MEKHRVLIGVPGSTMGFHTARKMLNTASQIHEVELTQAPWAWNAFNTVWADALNAAAAGECTHFAMLHLDVVPQDFWLDPLLAEMDRLYADAIAAVVPIKDDRGLTTIAIGDLCDRWNPLRRLTLKEIYKLPETFDAADAGYPESPLLWNEGCCVMDLRQEVFHRTDDTGRARVYFGSPMDVSRGEDGKFRTRWEPEDWFFSRQLHDAGGVAYATRKVRLDHVGPMAFPNDRPWGRYEHDEESRPKWDPCPASLKT